MARILICRRKSRCAASFAAAGHEVAVAADGAEAADILAKNPFDLLLADIKMPAMDGIALALAAARDHPGTRILLMTGYADQRERAYGLDALIHGVVTKPFSVAEIRFQVAAALAAKG
jgi:CheY-like chemotaxis protein